MHSTVPCRLRVPTVQGALQATADVFTCEGLVGKQPGCQRKRRQPMPVAWRNICCLAARRWKKTNLPEVNAADGALPPKTAGIDIRDVPAVRETMGVARPDKIIGGKKRKQYCDLLRVLFGRRAEIK